jgi:hypothetical protein
MLQELVSRQDASTVTATPVVAQAQQLLMQGARSMAKGDEEAGLARLNEADALLKKETKSTPEGSKHSTVFDSVHADVTLARGLAMQTEGEQLSSEAAQALKQAVEGRPELAQQMKQLRPDEYREILAEASQIGGGGGAKSTLAAPVDKETVKVEANKDAEKRTKKEAGKERANKEAEEERAKKEVEERAKTEEEERAKREADEERAKKEVEESAKKEASEERVKNEAEERAMKEAEPSPIVCSSVEDAIKHIEGGAVSLE